MTHSTILHNVQPDELATLFANVAEATYKKLLAESHHTPEQKEDRLLSRKDVCALLHISFTSLHDKMKSGALPFKRLGRRILFQESEVMKAISTTKRRRG